ncbi:MAG: ligase 1 [Bacillota bacterium]|nr:ligase 1 [Bacillota bacterium]MDK2960588.1 ligase 1 [Bacillota bacterium]
MLPETIVPMEPTLVRTPFDDPEFFFQVKWDGIRLLSFIENGELRLQNRRLRRRDGFYPELDALPDLLGRDGVVLDGEAVAFKEGKPSFPLILRREQVTSPSRAREMARRVPVVYLVFDILYLEGEPLLGRPLAERQERLQEVLRPAAETLALVENFPSGTALFRAVQAKGLEGIVAKRRNSLYVPGKSRDWLKVKVRRRQLCLVGGYSAEGKRLKSLLVGAWHGDKLVYLGRVGTGLTAHEWDRLAPVLEDLASPICPFAACPRGRDYRWVRPVLPVWVEYSEWTEDLKLRAPSIAGFARAKPEKCRLEGAT